MTQDLQHPVPGAPEARARTANRPAFGSGLASGIDTKAIIDAILNVERKPLDRLQNRQQLFSQRKAAFDELRKGQAARQVIVFD